MVICARALGNPFSRAMQYCRMEFFSLGCGMQMRFLHLDKMRVQFGRNDAVMLKVTNLLIGRGGSSEDWSRFSEKH